MAFSIEFPYLVTENGPCAIGEAKPLEGKLIYEVIRVVDGKPLFYAEHMDRLCHSAKLMGISMAPYQAALNRSVAKLIEVTGMIHDNVRIEVVASEQGDLKWQVSGAKGFYPPANWYVEGISATVLDEERDAPNAKIVNQSLAQRVANLKAELGIFEALLRNASGCITEGSRSNCFLIVNGQLIGPPDAQVLKGITRDKIIACAKALGIQYHEENLTSALLETAEAVLISGTSIDLLPICNLDGKTLDSATNETFKRLLGQYRAVMAESLKQVQVEGLFMERAYERLLRYVTIDTKSDDASETVPSTAKQFDLAKVLVEELLAMGIEDAHVDDKCYIMGTLKGNVANAPTIGLIAHMDTAPDFSGTNVKPQMHKNYDGKDIVLNAAENIVMDIKNFPELLNYVGQDIITTDGTTLLGADDKAGIAEIMTVIETLIKNPEIKHGDIKIGFTPDEEVGRGADFFNVEKFGAKFAYTVDGGEVGELEYENFNAASAKITISGRNIHPGNAKNKMINSALIANELINMLPAFETPATTEGYEGFYHLTDITGEVEETSLAFIIRDHDKARFENRKAYMTSVVEFLKGKYPEAPIALKLTDSYYNMREMVEPVIEIVDIVKEAMELTGVKPLVKAIRGGTDGSRLSYMGLPCPNIFTGGHNFHGRFEYIPVQSMDAAVKVIVKMLEMHAERA